jgi:hypothetical protein
MLNSTFTVFTCMSLFTKHNYKAKKLNYLTLKSSIQNEWTLGIQKVRYATCYTLVWPNARAAPLERVPENVIPLDSLTIV